MTYPPDVITGRRSETVTVTTEYVTIRCGKCGCVFERALYEYSRTFGCPRC